MMMEEEEKHNIKITLAGKEYEYKLPPSLEGEVRKAADSINARVETLMKRYANLSVQDALSTSILEYVVSGNIAASKRIDDTSEIMGELDAMNGQLEEYLGKKE
jgi:hypothetical protein